MTDQVQDQDVELDEEIEEAHDPKNAEDQSIASVSAAEDKGPRAKARKGDKKNSMPAEKAKGVTAENFEMGYSEELAALVESEATLSEEFKAKTALIFEAAIKAKLSEEVDRLEEAYATELNEEKEAFKAELVEKVDSYLNYVVENWMEENKLAIQTGLRTEIAEGFMDKLKGLFVESYIEVPEGKVDLVDELATVNEELEESYNEAVAKAMELAEELESYKRESIIREHSRDLAETQVEKLKSLVEDIDFESEETFAKKVATVKESFFAKKEAAIAEEVDTDDDASSEEINEAMAHYIKALRKTR